MEYADNSNGFVEDESSGQQKPSSTTFFETSKAVHELCVTVLCHPEENKYSPSWSFAEEESCHARNADSVASFISLERAGISILERSPHPHLVAPYLGLSNTFSSRHLQNVMADGSTVIL
jgi:hypothetical protein